MPTRRPLDELNNLFGRLLTARLISEPLLSFDAERDAVAVSKTLEEHAFDVVGVRRNGRINGWARRTALTSGQLGDHRRPFSVRNTISENAPLVRVLKRLATTPAVFLEMLGDVGAIVTRGDLQKTPVRLWLFGLVSLVEVRLLAEIRAAGIEEAEARALLAPGRSAIVEEILAGLRRRAEEIDFLECLNYVDKKTLCSKTKRIQLRLGFPSRAECESVLGRLEPLRNDAAHGRPIDTRHWGEVFQLARHAQRIVGVDS